MTRLENYICDNCQKLGTTKEHYSIPLGWYEINIDQNEKNDSRTKDVLRATVCSPECLLDQLQELKKTLVK